MPIVSIELPHVGESVVEGIIDRWLKKPGDTIKKYDSLVEVVTDKVNMEVPSPFDGVLTRILAEEGATIPMGAVIAEMETDIQTSRREDGGNRGRSGGKRYQPGPYRGCGGRGTSR